MAEYSLNRYISGSNARFYKYQIKGGHHTDYIPLIVFDADIPYQPDIDTYTISSVDIVITTPFQLPTYHEARFEQPTSGTGQWVNVFAYQLSDPRFQIQSASTIGLGAHFLIYDDNNNIVWDRQQNFPNPSKRFCNSYILLFIRFTNAICFLCDNDVTSENVLQPIEPASGIEPGTKGTMSETGFNLNVPFPQTYFKSKNDTLQELNTWEYLVGESIEVDPFNPYTGGDVSTDPGNGEFDYGGDEIDIPDLPTVSVADSGFVSLFAPSESQLKALAKFMWSDTFSLASFKKLFNNPMDCILGLSIVPVNLPTGTAKEITVGNIVSTVKCNVCTKQFVTVNCGSLRIRPTQFTGGYLDYSPYTKCYIYLPFIGIQQLNIDDVMNSTVNVVYHVDILTGACVCFLKMTNRTTGGRSQPNAVLYTFSGQCSESVPLSSTSFSQTMGSILTAAGAIGGAVATIASGGTAAPVAGALTTAATSTANAATSMKPNIQHSGSMGGSSGFMNIRYPFMIFDCPHTAIPLKQYEYTGFPSNAIVKLSELSGFNIVQAINLSVKGAMDTECDMIKSALESGVIF